jgi:hypothetical protein
MSPARIAIALAALTASAAAHAGQHSICYEGPTRVTLNGISPTTVLEETLTMVVGCIDDSGARCVITPVGADVPGLASPVQLKWDRDAHIAAQRIATSGEFAFYEFSQANTSNPARATRLRATITFKSGDVHDCDVTPRGYIAAPWTTNGSPAYQGHATGVLTGFSTDASGHVTTGVWRTSQKGGFAQSWVPGDFIVVGGGASAGDDGFIEASRFSDALDPLRGWEAKAYNSSNSTLMPPSGPTASYAIGLRIRGLPTNLTPLVPDGMARANVHDLRALVGRMEASSVTLAPGQPMPDWSVALPTPVNVALGGGIDARATINARNNTGRGVFAVGNHPVDALRWLACAVLLGPCPPPQATGWRTAAVSELGFYVGDVSVRQAFLPAKVDIDGTIWEVRGRMVSATSAVGQVGSKMEVKGLRGAYAVVGVGGLVNWRPYTRWYADINTWLARIEPRLDIGGAAVESRVAAAPPGTTSLTAYALGIRLVPAGTPPDVEEPVHAVAIDTSWLCTIHPMLQESSACRGEIKLVKVSEFCRSFPDMPKYDLCTKP